MFGLVVPKGDKNYHLKNFKNFKNINKLIYLCYNIYTKRRKEGKTMSDKQNLITMLSNSDVEFRVEHGNVYIPCGDTNTVAVFEFDKDSNLVIVYSREWGDE